MFYVRSPKSQSCLKGLYTPDSLHPETSDLDLFFYTINEVSPCFFSIKFDCQHFRINLCSSKIFWYLDFLIYNRKKTTAFMYEGLFFVVYSTPINGYFEPIRLNQMIMKLLH